MRRLSALTLACILLLAACGAPAEGSASASSSGASSSSASASAQTEPEETAASAAFTLAACPAYSFHPVLAENSVNLALALAAEGEQVMLADLDIVNPYFRTKDSEQQLSAEGIGLICSPFANSNLDVPAMPKETYALIGSRTQYGVLDIGGDDRGALALGRYTPEIREESNYEMLLVVNCARPLTRTAEDTVQVLREIEAACGLPFTGIVNNTNLGPQTAAEDVLSSVPYAEAVSRLTGLPVFMTCCAEALYPELAGTIDRLFPLKLQKLYYQLTQEVSYGKTNISGRAL